MLVYRGLVYGRYKHSRLSPCAPAGMLGQMIEETHMAPVHIPELSAKLEELYSRHPEISSHRALAARLGRTPQNINAWITGNATRREEHVPLKHVAKLDELTNGLGIFGHPEPAIERPFVIDGARHRRALTGMYLEEAERSQHAHGFTNRGDARSELIRERSLRRQRVTRAELTGQERVVELFRDDQRQPLTTLHRADRVHHYLQVIQHSRSEDQDI